VLADIQDSLLVNMGKSLMNIPSLAWNPKKFEVDAQTSSFEKNEDDLDTFLKFWKKNKFKKNWYSFSFLFIKLLQQSGINFYEQLKSIQQKRFAGILGPLLIHM
jgi:hypothetical protein